MNGATPAPAATQDGSGADPMEATYALMTAAAKQAAEKAPPAAPEVVAGDKPKVDAPQLAAGKVPATLDNGPSLTMAVSPQAQPQGPGGAQPPQGPDNATKAKPSEKPDLSGPHAIDAWAPAVEFEESKGHQFNKDGSVFTSAKGARGVMQLMPKSFPGQNIDDEATNRRLGRDYLTKLRAQYGDWPTAVIAYNWGPANADKWVAGGRDWSKLPADTQAYLGRVMFKAGAVDNPANALLAAKADAGQDSFLNMLDDINKEGAEPDDATAPAPAAGDGDTDGVATSVAVGDEADGMDPPSWLKAAFTGARRGLLDVPLGQAQTVMRYTNPEEAQKLTELRQNWERPFQEDVDKHPWVATGGYMIGATGGLLAEAGLLTAGAEAVGLGAGVAATAAVMRKLPLLSSVAVGAVSNMTKWKDDTNASDWFERVGHEVGAPDWLTDAVVGGGEGTIFGGVAKTVMKSMQYASKVGVPQRLHDAVAGLKVTLGDISRNANVIKEKFDGAYAAVEQTMQDKFKLRNAAGQRIDGFDFDHMDAALKKAIESHAEQGVGIAPGVAAEPEPSVRAEGRTAVEEARDTMGITREMAERKLHQMEMDKYDEAIKKYGMQTTPGVATSDEIAKLQKIVLDQAEQQGKLPPRPAPREPGSLKARDMYRALTKLNDRLKRTPKASGAQRYQLNSIVKAIHASAAEQASAMGMSEQEAVRTLEAANEHYRTNVVPFRQIAGGLGAKEYAAQSTPAEMYDMVLKVANGGDFVKIDKMAKLLGPDGQRHMGDVLLHNILSDAQKGEELLPEKAIKDFQDHKETLFRLLGRDQSEKLEGSLKLAGQMYKDIEKGGRPHKIGPGWGPVLAADKFMEGVGRGDPIGGAIHGAEAFVGIVGAHMLYNVIRSTLRAIPAMLPVVKRAAKMDPDGAALQELSDRIAARMRRRLAVSIQTQANAPAWGQSPDNRPVPTLQFLPGQPGMPAQQPAQQPAQP